MLWIKTDFRHDLGFLPELISEADPRPVAKQLENAYAHGGGWRPMDGFRIVDKETMTILYPGDPPMKPVAISSCHNEMLYFYPHDFLLIMQKDGTFEIARVD